METLNFTYNNNTYVFEYYKNDPSGLGCIYEIVTNNEYVLENFVNYEEKHIIDIGANCGVATMILAKQNPLSTIYSFEPDRNVYALLVNNIKKNNLTNVKAFNKAVSKDGISSLELCLHPNYSGGNSTYSNNKKYEEFFQTNITSYEVECISLDKIIIENNITKLELLKIDCEGAEYDILYGSEFIKRTGIKNMVGEFHNMKYNVVENTAENLIKYCRQFTENILKITVLNI